jgi:beta-lactamase superfamily II metal-dependent hydrolase
VGPEVFRLHVFPAGIGDALVVEYGKSGNTRLVLVDGGVAKTGQAVARFLGDNAQLELLVVTHIDNDHIAGILELLNRRRPPQPKDVWFNGYRHLPESRLEEMGPVEGEKLTELIVSRGYQWNAEFAGKAVVADPHPLGAPVTVELDSELSCTVLSPGQSQLRALRSRWAEVVGEAGLDPRIEPPKPVPTSGLERMGPPDIAALAYGDTPEDKSVANGSTIALLLEYAGHKCLLAGDAHPAVLIRGINSLVGSKDVLQVDVLKLPHHGSKANVTRELLTRVRAHTYVFSTDGTGNQRHPNDQAVARVVRYGGDSPVLAFNYRSERNRIWDDNSLRLAHGYHTLYPTEDDGIVIDLLNPKSSS